LPVVSVHDYLIPLRKNWRSMSGWRKRGRVLRPDAQPCCLVLREVGRTSPDAVATTEFVLGVRGNDAWYANDYYFVYDIGQTQTVEEAHEAKAAREFQEHRELQPATNEDKVSGQKSDGISGAELSVTFNTYNKPEEREGEGYSTKGIESSYRRENK